MTFVTIRFDAFIYFFSTSLFIMYSCIFTLIPITAPESPVIFSGNKEIFTLIVREED